ncbi:MAG TPA: glycerol dehydrogenase [Gemmatimonadota bacterium]|nr:glycerol dehydrogenase [Gemmatimonadota bacterium]
MQISEAYSPFAVFVPSAGAEARPRVLIAPARYVQGEGALHGMGRYLQVVGADRAGILISAGGEKRVGRRLVETLARADVAAEVRIFGGECSLAEIEAASTDLREAGIDCLVAVGGGKCVDTGKAVAFRLGVPVVIVPTLASNDAPCSALSVIYSPEGVSTGAEFYPDSPALVVVDTRIVADAPERYLVAGLGDAMATYYEAAVCSRNSEAMTCVGARPTLAASAIGLTCRDTLFEKGEAAAAAVAASRVDSSLEDVVEANTLLSGLGFESGGVAAAHGYAQSFTVLPDTDAGFLHGEMVAMGTLAQLMLEDREDEARKVGSFFTRVGLPVQLSQIAVDPADSAAIGTVVEAALQFPFLGNMPGPTHGEALERALLEADRLGRALADEMGDAAYRRLHA